MSKARKAVDRLEDETVQKVSPERPWVPPPPPSDEETEQRTRIQSMVAVNRIGVPAADEGRRVDAALDEELFESVRTHGVLVPILVQELAEGMYRVIAGRRRFAASLRAGRQEIPAVIMTRGDAREVELVENIQRAPLHAIDEAEGYQALRSSGVSVEEVASRVSKNARHVYDRLGLLRLTKEAKALFLRGLFTEAHAVLLARLAPEAQARAIDPQVNEHHPALFTREGSISMFDAERDGKDKYAGLKPVSVREFSRWIDDHVKLRLDQVDGFLFPETAAVVGGGHGSAEKPRKVIPITRDHYVQADARDGERVIGPRSWREAGKKKCDHLADGVIVVGDGRAETFPICVEKHKCKVHWGDEIREREKRAKGTPDEVAEERRKAVAREKAQWARDQQERTRWDAARPAILTALGDKLRRAPAGGKSPAGQLVIRTVRGRFDGSKPPVIGSTAEHVVRCAAYLILAGQADSWSAPRDFPKLARTFGVDVRKILAAVKVEEPKAKD